MIRPLIKWTGSKRAQAEQIISHFPKEIDTYYEPFLGGGSVFGTLIRDNSIKVNKYVCTDLNIDLIAIWKCVQNDPQEFIGVYRELWERMNCTGKTPKEKESFYRQHRSLYNAKKQAEPDSPQPMLFNFILRTCFNGLVRYDKEGNFNTSFHHNRNGIIPDTFAKIVMEWHDVISKHDVVFECKDFKSALANVRKNDLVYMDPPYEINQGMYFHENFDGESFFEFVNKNVPRFAFSYDGKSGVTDNTVKGIPLNYDSHEYVYSNISAFKKLTQKKTEDVYDSLYLKGI